MIRAGIFEALERLPIIVECRSCGHKFDAKELEPCSHCGAGCVAEPEQEAAERLAEIARNIDADSEIGLVGQV